VSGSVLPRNDQPLLRPLPLYRLCDERDVGDTGSTTRLTREPLGGVIKGGGTANTHGCIVRLGLVGGWGSEGVVCCD
jgi:hypothetical protein